MTAMLKTIAKIVAAILAVPVLLFLLVAAAYDFTYIGETITTGSEYGFSVGASKADVLAKIRETQPAFHEIWVGKPYFSLDVRAAGTLRFAESSDRWTMFYGDKMEFLDTLSFKFESDRLVEMRRSRRLFELP